MQTKTESFIESISNVAIGYMVALFSQIVIFPFYDINISLPDNLMIGVWFTIISITRSYLIRRYFNLKLFTFNEK
jgi:hypothetical protein